MQAVHSLYTSPMISAGTPKHDFMPTKEILHPDFFEKEKNEPGIEAIHKEIIAQLYKKAPMVNINNVTLDYQGIPSVGKIGALLMSVLPLEARVSLARTKEHVNTAVLGDIKSIGFMALLSSAVTSVFNLNFVYIVLIMLVFAAFDWIMGIAPKPKGLDDVEDKGDRSLLDRLHMFVYLMLGFIVLSGLQVLVSVLVEVLDPAVLNDLSQSYPTASRYIKDTLGLHTVAALGVTFYYIKRIKPHLSVILFRKSA